MLPLATPLLRWISVPAAMQHFRPSAIILSNRKSSGSDVAEIRIKLSVLGSQNPGGRDALQGYVDMSYVVGPAFSEVA